VSWRVQVRAWGHDYRSTVAWTIPGLTEGASWPPPPGAIGGGWWYGGGVGIPCGGAYIPCGGAPCICGGAPCIGGGAPCIGGGCPRPGGGGAYVGPGRCKGPDYRRTRLVTGVTRDSHCQIAVPPRTHKMYSKASYSVWSLPPTAAYLGGGGGGALMHMPMTALRAATRERAGICYERRKTRVPTNSPHQSR
jgi:hypothetical protein